MQGIWGRAWASTEFCVEVWLYRSILRQLTQQLVSHAFAVAWPLFLQLTQHLAYRVCVADMLAFVLLFEQLVQPCLWLASLPIFVLFIRLTPRCGELYLALAFSVQSFFSLSSSADSENNWLLLFDEAMGFKERLYSLEKQTVLFACTHVCCNCLHCTCKFAFAKLEQLIYGLYRPGMRMCSRIFHVYVHRAI